MIKYEEKTVTETRQIPVSKVCDRCERDIKDFEELVEIRHEFGYGTHRDGDYFEVDICEDCILEVLKNSYVKVRYFKKDFKWQE